MVTSGGRGASWLRGRGIWLAWGAIRFVGLCLLTGNFAYPQVDVDILEYQSWAHLVFAGQVPWRDFMVEYPPGVFPAMLIPGSRAVYELEFTIIAMAVDALVLAMLLRRNMRRGAWLWCIMPIAAGPVVWVRFDIFLAALLIGFALAVREGRWRTAAVCISVAALLKLWPLILVLVAAFYLPRAGVRRFLTWVVATVAIPVLAVITLGGAHGLWRMLSFQGGRGLEVESLWAVPYEIAHSLLIGPAPGEGHGSGEYVVHGWLSLIITAAAPVTLILLGTAYVRCLRAGRRLSLGNTMLAIVAVLLVTSKVLSAQYVLWALAAVAIVLDDLPAPRARRLALVTVAFAATTQLLFPIFWWGLIINNVRGLVATVLHAEVLVLWAAVALQTAFARPTKPGADTGSLQAEDPCTLVATLSVAGSSSWAAR